MRCPKCQGDLSPTPTMYDEDGDLKSNIDLELCCNDCKKVFTIKFDKEE